MGACVVVVEDNADNLELLRFLLDAYGHSPVLTTNAPDAIEAARRERPDLILMDLQLPGMDGFEAMRILREDRRTARIPVIAVTALAMVGDREAALRAGFDGYISKPIAPRTFTDEVDAFLAPELRSRQPGALKGSRAHGG